jgi:cAMP phosphodiesterase
VTSGGAPAIGSSLGITGKGAGALALVDAIRLALIPLLGLDGVVRRRFQCPAFAESIDESQLDDGIVEYVMGLLSESLVQALDESEVESRASKASKSTAGEETESDDKSTNRSKTVRQRIVAYMAGHG